MLQPKLNYVLLIILLIWAGCKPKSKEPQVTTTNKTTQSYQSYIPPVTQSPSYSETEDPAYYDDGVYCATVRYTNQNTQAQSIYMLNVEVADGKLAKIHWPNGGWLDDSHFDPPHVNQGGFTTFVSDKGYEYDVLLKSAGVCKTGSSNDFNYYSNTYSENSSTLLEDEENEETKLENEYGRYKAEVVKRISGCDYMILENNGDFYVVEWMGSYDPDEGDIIQGNLRSYGTETFYVHRRDRDTRLYVEDYDITLSRAWEIIRNKCNLDEEEE